MECFVDPVNFDNFLNETDLVCSDPSSSLSSTIFCSEPRLYPACRKASYNYVGTREELFSVSYIGFDVGPACADDGWCYGAGPRRRERAAPSSPRLPSRGAHVASVVPPRLDGAAGAAVVRVAVDVPLPSAASGRVVPSACRRAPDGAGDVPARYAHASATSSRASHAADVSVVSASYLFVLPSLPLSKCGTAG